MNSQALFVCDSLINCVIAAELARNYQYSEVLYLIDPDLKAPEDYLRSASLICGASISEFSVATYDSRSHWQGRYSAVDLSRKQKDRCEDKEVAVFVNWFTNPLGKQLAASRNLEFLFHSPSDFFYSTPMPVWDFQDWKTFTSLVLSRQRVSRRTPSLLNFRWTNSSELVSCPSPNTSHGLWISERAKIMKRGRLLLLQSGPEPLLGDGNDPECGVYGPIMLEMIKRISSPDSVDEVILKEHRSFRPLLSSEKCPLQSLFSAAGFELVFFSDLVPWDYRLFPGELLVDQLSVIHAVGEASSLLLNVAHRVDSSIMRVSGLRRGLEEKRDFQFLRLNSQLRARCAVVKL